MRPNLQQEFMVDQVPNIETQTDWNDLNDEQSNPVSWVARSILPVYLQLSMSCSWRFTNLNVAFPSMVGEPSRSLHVHSDVTGSTIVENSRD